MQTQIVSLFSREFEKLHIYIQYLQQFIKFLQNIKHACNKTTVIILRCQFIYR